MNAKAQPVITEQSPEHAERLRVASRRAKAAADRAELEYWRGRYGWAMNRPHRSDGLTDAERIQRIRSQTFSTYLESAMK